MRGKVEWGVGGFALFGLIVTSAFIHTLNRDWCWQQLYAARPLRRTSYHGVDNKVEQVPL